MFHHIQKKILTLLLTTLAATSPTIQAEAQQLIVNGDFERPPLADGTWFLTLSNGDARLDGWDVLLSSIDIVSTQTGKPWLAKTRRQGIDLLGTPGPGSIIQEVPTLPGQTYELKFATSSNGGAKPFGLMFFWDSNQVDVISTTPSDTWVDHTYTLVASSQSTLLQFVGNVVPNQSPNDGSLLDSVRLETVCPFVIPVANGDFEDPKLISNVAVTKEFSKFLGWTIEAPSGTQGIGHIIGKGGQSQSVNLSSTIGAGTLQQSLATKPQATYQLSFLRKSAANPQTTVMTVQWGGVTIPVSGTGGQWRRFNISLANASGTATLLQLIGGTQGDVYVDDVQVLELCQGSSSNSSGTLSP